MPLKNKPIAMFSLRYKLAGLFPSIKEAAQTANIPRQSIIKHLHGELMIAGKRYWRLIPNDIILDQDDLGKLTIFEFDKRINYPDRELYKIWRDRKIKVLESELAKQYNKKH